MKPLALAATLAFSVAAFGPSAEAARGAAADSVTVFVGVSVLPMDADRILEGHTVVVTGERISAIGPDGFVDFPPAANRIDGTGRFLMPGLAEMHGHIPPGSRPEAEVANTLFLYLANGITTVRGMLGWEGQLALREQANAGAIDSPTLYLAGPSFSGNSVSSPRQASERVATQAEEGWNLLKVHPGLTRTEYDAMAATANDLGIRFGGHVPTEVGLLHALEVGQETFDHLDGYVEYLQGIDPEQVDEVALGEIVRKTVEAGAWVVPTMVLWETILSYPEIDDLLSFPELRYVPAATEAGWERSWRQRRIAPEFDLEQVSRFVDARMRVLAGISDGGALILMGTDAPQQFSVPGFSLHREIVRMSEAGMTPFEVLQSGTANVGAYFANEDDFGTIAVGKRADLILLRENPLVDVRNVSERLGVMVRGRWFPETVIQARLAQIEALYRR